MSLSPSTTDAGTAAGAVDRSSGGQGASAVPRAEPSSWTATRPGVWAFPLYLGVQLLLLAGLRVAVPRFFWFDDAQIQFMPMYWWLGRGLGDGSLPLLDPDQGMAGNLTADMQNGVLDPVRWPFMLWAGGQEDLQHVATVHGWLSVLALGCSALALLLNHRVRPAFAVATAVGAATSGFFLWYGSAWAPAMWSLAALVWLWAALSSRRWYGVVGVAFAVAAVLCAGNPYIWPMLPVLLVCQVHERWRRDGRRLWRDRRTWATVVALAAGAAASLPTLLNLVDVGPWMWRLPAEETIGAAGGGTNVLDIVLGGTTLLNFPNVPLFSTAVIALPLLAFTDWRRAWAGPGVVTAGALWVAAVLWTQLPHYFLVFRIPFRLLSAVAVAFALLAVLAVTAAPRLTRRRVTVALGLVLLQFVLTLMRAPVFWRWHVVGLCLGVAAVVAVVVLLRPRISVGPRRDIWLRLAAAATVVAVCALPLAVQFGMQSGVQERYEAIVLGANEPGVPVYRPNTGGYGVGTTVTQFRDNSLETDTSLTVFAFGAFDDPRDRGWQRGLLGGNLNLLAGLRPGFGSLAVWPRGVQQHLTANYQSALDPNQPGLLEVPDGVEVPWVDLLSSNRVLLGVDGAVPAPIGAYFDQNWTFVAEREGYREYTRRQPLPGRVTAVLGGGVTVQDAAANDGVATLDGPFERYTVTTGGEGGSLVFRTPYWNGFSATVDGRPVEVTAFDDALVQVRLPAGVSEGSLELTFAPLGARILPASLVAGGALLVIAAVLAVWRGRTREQDAAS
ncbi:hypothetical protein [Blastococcus sp. SYSU D00695]